MDVLIPFALSILAVLGSVAAIAGVESRDGFDRDSFGADAQPDPFHRTDTRSH
jgi:hypothetical protein